MFNDIKRYIVYLAANLNHRVKPDWCHEFKILVCFTRVFEPDLPFSIALEPLERVIKQCRKYMKQLKYIRLCGPIGKTFNYHNKSDCFAAIEMATNDAEFQIAFTSFPSRPYYD